MKTLGNILWHIPFLGFISATITFAIGLLLTLTVVAAPIGMGLMELGKMLFLPFGKAMVKKEDLGQEHSKTWETYSVVIKLVYVLLIGWWLALLVAIQAAILFFTIVGIPASIVVAKSLGTYLNPVNKKCVSSAVADELERRETAKELDKLPKV